MMMHIGILTKDQKSSMTVITVVSKNYSQAYISLIPVSQSQTCLKSLRHKETVLHKTDTSVCSERSSSKRTVT